MQTSAGWYSEPAASLALSEFVRSHAPAVCFAEHQQRCFNGDRGNDPIFLFSNVWFNESNPTFSVLG